MLDGLELADGAAELLADLRVLGGRRDRPVRDAARLGGEQDGGEVADPRAVHGHGPPGGHGGPLCRDLGGEPGGVGAVVGPYGQRPGVDGEPQRAVGGLGGQQDQVGVRAAEHGWRGAVQYVTVARRDGGQRPGPEGDGRGALSVDEGTGEVGAVRGEQGGGEDGGQVRARERGPAGLLQDHRQVEQFAAVAPALVWQMRPEQPEFGEPGPPRRPPGAAAGGVEQFAHLFGRHGAGDPAADGLRQFALLLRDSDAHARRLEHVSF